MKQSPTRVLLIGAAGRMGHAITDAAKENPNIDIVASCDVGDPIEPAISHSNVVVDFSHAEAIGEICRAASKYRQAIVIGTTGHSDAQVETVKKCAKAVPIVMASNFSLGVNLLFWLTRKASELLGQEFEVEIIEAHHRLKKDAPSGTAKSLAAIVTEVRKLSRVRCGREGATEARSLGEVGIHSIRGGDIVGDHTVMFCGAGERLELTHRASSRQTFAAGALRAAEWVVDKPAGLYSMGDVLGV